MQEAYNYNCIGGVAYQQGNFNDAIEYGLKALKLYEKYDQKKQIAKSLGNIGAILRAIGNKEAVNYYRRCIKIDEEFYWADPKSKTLKTSLSSSYHNLGAVFTHFGDSDSSMRYFKKALALLDTNEANDRVAVIYTGMAQAYKENSNFKTAVYYNQKALKIYTELASPDGLSTTYNGFADIYLNWNKYKEAVHYSDLAEQIDKANNFTDDLLYAYETKALAYGALKDIKHEVVYLKKHSALKDSLLKQNHTIQMEELRTRYETEKKENEILKLSNDNKIQELQLEKDAATKNRLVMIIAVTILVLIIVGSLAGFLYKTVQEKKKAFVQLQVQSEELNRQSRLISKYQSQMNPHFVFNALNSIQGTVITDEKEKTIDRLQLLSQLMRQTLNNSENENISLDTEIKYLQTYIKFEKEKLNAALQFEVKYPEDHSNILIPPMMIQPFIENAIKHAGLKQIADPIINLTISVKNDFLKVDIKDNGKGFDAKDGSVLKNSHAIKMIQSRLQLLFLTENKSSDLRFEIISKPVLERGTEVKFYLPLKYKY